MAAGAKVIKKVFQNDPGAGSRAPQNNAKPNAKEKATEAMHKFGDWLFSVEGIVTIVAVIGLIWYINHKTKKKSA